MLLYNNFFFANIKKIIANRVLKIYTKTNFLNLENKINGF